MDNKIQFKLEDFLPYYKSFSENEDDDYNENNAYVTTYLKKEFRENKLPEIETKPTHKGDLLKHQKFISRFINFNTMYDEILLFGELGSGKTASAIAICEQAKKNNPTLKKALILVKSDLIKRNFIKEIKNVATKQEVYGYIDPNTKNIPSDEMIIRRIKKNYEFNTFGSFKNDLLKTNDKDIEKEYSNRVIVIDEAHNLRDEYDKDSTNQTYDSFMRFLALVKNRKIVLMTATMMRDRVDEFANLMNLILPDKIETGEKFNREYFETSGDLNEEKKEKLLKKIQGRISYVASMKSDLKIFDKGEFYKSEKDKANGHKGLEYIKIFKSNMVKNGFQYKAYEKEYLKSQPIEKITNVESNFSKKDRESFHKRTRDISMFVYPNGEFGKLERGSQAPKLLDNYLKGINDSDKSHIGILSRIKNCSSKFESALSKIIDNKNENAFVFSENVNNGGTNLFADLLKRFGYKDATNDYETLMGRIQFSKKKVTDLNTYDKLKRHANDKKKILEYSKHKKFILLTGDTKERYGKDHIDKMLNIFNLPENKHGNLIQVVIGSSILSEGNSLHNIRQIHILTPHWNNTTVDQSIGRGIRAFSHDNLDKEDQYVSIYRHCATIDEISGIEIEKKSLESIDYVLYKISDNKVKYISKIERLAKQSAVDCMLNRSRNMSDKKISHTKECDYQECKYKCFGINYDNENYENEIHQLDNESLDITTYNLYYANELMNELREKIKNKFSTIPSNDLFDLINKFSENSKFTLHLIIRALKYIIDNNEIIIYNKMACYLREEKNLFFLVNSVQLPNKTTLLYYTINPNKKSTYNFNNYVENKQEDILKKINEQDFDRINFIDPRNYYLYKYVGKLMNLLTGEYLQYLLEILIEFDYRKSSRKKQLRNVLMSHLKYYTNYPKTPTISTVKIIGGYCKSLEESTRKWSYSENIENIKPPKEFDNYKEYGIMINTTINRAINDIYKDLTKEVFQIKFENIGKKSDKRTIQTGVNCMSVKKIKLIPMLLKFKIDIPNSIETPLLTISELKEKINEYKKTLTKTDNDAANILKCINETNLENIDNLRRLWYWIFSSNLETCCKELQRWFKDNDRLFTKII